MKKETRSGQMTTIRGIPIFIHNDVIETPDDKFYISYNSHTSDYGCKTTALVLGQMEKFYILNGNHTEEYNKIIDQGFEACLNYFKNNIKDVNKLVVSEETHELLKELSIQI